jgi:predicted lipoprotein with Yx(FWY)xxD motif
VSRLVTTATTAAAVLVVATLPGCGLSRRVTGNDARGPAVVASQNPLLGDLVVDGRGRTLYRFDRDSSSPSRSDCVRECASTWVPLTAAARPEIRGVDPAQVGMFQRDDGGNQVTLRGWPLYTFVKDEQPGHVRGHAVTGTWWAVNPSGNKIDRRPAR